MKDIVVKPDKQPITFRKDIIAKPVSTKMIKEPNKVTL